MNFGYCEKNKENWFKTVSKVKIGTDLCKLAKVKLIMQAASPY
jgi:hypothetical protein